MKTEGLRKISWAVTLSVATFIGALAIALLVLDDSSASAVGPGVSASPRTDTMRVVDGEVLDSVVWGNRVVVVGTFTKVKNVGGNDINQSYIAAYNINTGNFDGTFRPQFNDYATSLQVSENGNHLFVGGQFTAVGGTFYRKLVKLKWDGDPVTGFNPAFNGTVNDVGVANGEVYVTGKFKTVNAIPREMLAAVDQWTGDPVDWVDFDFDFSVASGGTFTGKGLAISSDGSQLWLSHTTRFIEGQERTAIAKFNLGADSASLSNWHTDLYDAELDRFAGALRPRKIAISPDDSYVVMVSSGGDRPPAGDTAVRFPTSGGFDTQADWVSRNFDSVLGVAISPDAVFVGGHFQFQEAPGSTNPFPGDKFTNYGFGFGQGPSQLGDEVVPREQLGALDPLTGKSLDWNPGSDSFLGPQSVTWDPDHGLLVGHDGSRLGGVSDIGRHAIFPIGNDPEPPPDPGDEFVCQTSVDGTAVNLTFSGLRGRTENLRRVGGGWVATVTGLDTYRVNNAVGDSFLVRVKGDEFAEPFEDIACTAGGGNQPVTLETSIDAPADGTLVAPGQFTLQGEASAPGGIEKVRLTVAKQTTGEYLKPDGTFTSAWTPIDVEFNTPTEALTWSQTLTITDTGEYNVTAKTFANDGSKDDSRAESSLRIGATNDDPPSMLIEGPRDPIIGDDLMTIFGTATDDLGIATVTFNLRERDLNLYLRQDGTLGAAERFTATLSSPGGTFTTWTRTLDVPVGEWQATVDAIDTSGQRFRRSQLISVAGDVEPPTIEITGGRDQKKTANSRFTFSGNAQAPGGLEKVEILIRNPLDYSGVQANNAVGANSAYFTLPGVTGGTSANWSYQSPQLPAGTYDVFTRVTDALGVRETDQTQIIVGPNGDDLPTLAVTASTRYQQNLDSLEVTITGTASDDNGIDRVAARIFDRKAKQWVELDGDTGPRPQAFDATVNNPGATDTSWTITFQTTKASTYFLYFYAIDDAGQLSSTATFASARIYPGDDLPTVTLNLPTNNQTITTNRISASGSARDDVGVGGIQVLIRNNDTGEFLRRDGTFGSAQWIDGALTNPGADRSNFDYSSPVLPDGEYRLSVRSVDINDQTTIPVTVVTVNLT